MIYLDNAATTKPSLSALEKADKFNKDLFFNPSALYREGLLSSKEIKLAKENVLRYLGLSVDKYEVIFTSCGSESDNAAILNCGKKSAYLTDKGEHAAVYKSFLELKNKGNTVVFIDLNKNGSINEDLLYDYVRHNNIEFVSIMHVNNETGAINDINNIAKKIKAINPKIIFHSDGVQAFGKLQSRLSDSIDLYSISAHKVNALKGVGALIKKKSVNISPIIFGGGQENGFRSGTENLFGIKVFDYACKEHFDNIKDNYTKVTLLNQHVRENIDKGLFEIISDENCSPYILSISAKGLRGEVVMHTLETEGIIVGNGSACSSKNRYSRVIEACGYKNEVLDGVIRISFSPENTIDEIKVATNKLNKIAFKLKGIMK